MGETSSAGQPQEKTAARKWLEVNPHGIPDELKQLPQWVVWAFEARAKGEEQTKIPYSPDGRRRAKANDVGTWGDFGVALSTYMHVVGRHVAGRHVVGERFAGIGFEFAADGGLVGIDLDKCRDPESGELADWAADIVKRFNTYTEVSPSGTGVKLWCRGKLPGDGKGKKRTFHSGAVEAYDRGRYFAVTGHVVESTPESIRDAQAEIDWLWQTAFARRSRIRENSGGNERRPDFSRSRLRSLTDRARKYLAKLPPAISGQNGHDQTFTAACTLVLGFDLRPDEAFPLLAQYNERCEPPWSEGELNHKLRSALAKKDEGATVGYLLNAEKPAPRQARRSPPPAQATPKEASGDDGQQIRNWERLGKGDDAQYWPLPMTTVLATLRKATGDWPRRVGRALFAHEGESEIAWMESTAAAFGYLESKTGIVPWRSGVGYVTQERVYEELRRTSTEYAAVERFPHWPNMEGHYYACETPRPGDGSTLNRSLLPVDADRSRSDRGHVRDAWLGWARWLPAGVPDYVRGRSGCRQKQKRLDGRPLVGWLYRRSPERGHRPGEEAAAVDGRPE